MWDCEKCSNSLMGSKNIINKKNKLIKEKQRWHITNYKEDYSKENKKLSGSPRFYHLASHRRVERISGEAKSKISLAIFKLK